MKRIIITTGILLVTASFAFSPTAGAVKLNIYGDECKNNPGSTLCTATQEGATNPDDSMQKLIRNIINVLLTAVGVISIVMIIVGGMRYAISNGDSNQVSAAKNTVLYAVIGLIVALFSFAIVNLAYTRSQETPAETQIRQAQEKAAQDQKQQEEQQEEGKED